MANLQKDIIQITTTNAEQLCILYITGDIKCYSDAGKVFGSFV